MSDTEKVEAEASPTVITLVLPVDKTKPATVTVRNGDLGHLSSFAYDDFKDICTALNDGMRAFVGVQANPPQNIQATKPVSKPVKPSKKKKASKKQAKAKGKAPYRLQDASGQTRTLSKMLDPFELQEKYYKANPSLKFDSLEEACEVAQSLIDAGIEKTVTITYSNGQAVKVLPEPEVVSTDVVADETSAEEVAVTEAVATVADDVPASDETSGDGVSITDETSADDVAVTDDAVSTDVPATEAVVTADDAPVSEDLIVNDTSTIANASTRVKPAPVIQVLTSPELAEAEGVPEYNEFSLATDDDDDTDESSIPVPETAQTKLF